MEDESDYREIGTSKAQFDSLRSDRKFAKLLNLARAVNAIYFCFNALLDYSGDETPAGQRQHINAFLFSTGALHEAFTVADSLEKHFGERNSYKNGFGRLLASTKTKELRRTILRRMRNKFVFHYDEDVSRKMIKKLDLKSYIFATGLGGKRKGTYYNLADEVVINYLLKDVPNDEQDRVFREALESIGESLHEFIECADTLLGDVLSDDVWTLKRRRPKPST